MILMTWQAHPVTAFSPNVDLPLHLSPAGEMSDMYGRWRDELLRCMAHVAAFIDFGEDEGIHGDTLAAALDSV